MTNIQPKIIQHLRTDEKLRVLTETIHLHIDYAQSPVFDQLIKSVVSQQLSTSAAATIYSRFASLPDRRMPSEQAVLMLDIEKMRSAGLSAQKAAYIRNIAEYFSEKKLSSIDWDSYADDEIIRMLTTIKGVGTWTVQMLLMFTLHREDVFPADDLIIRKSIIQLYGLTSEKKQLTEEMHIVAESWRPYRSIACRYLWAGKDQLNIKL
jgi:DNA-3-methyladenine glycosylase II